MRARGEWALKSEAGTSAELLQSSIHGQKRDDGKLASMAGYSRSSCLIKLCSRSSQQRQDKEPPNNIPQLRRRGHFSKCPEEYKHYCVKGRCRYVMAEETPACVCEKGYTGARCERVDIFYLRGDQGQIAVICLIVAMVALIGLIICICTCSHHCRKRRRRRKEEEMETLEKELPTKQEDVLETDIA
ncbi:probetacellulin-like [Emys orbicularis]|uniref:probetacellulin-like n=1 Tax=Emys orbicularis TaxID=82168 RepID=UPI0031FD8A75